MEMTFSTSASYVVIPKKYFSRYILSYEVLPLQLCKFLNDKVVINLEELTSLCSAGALESSDIVLEMDPVILCSSMFIPFSMIHKVWFESKDTLELFLERSYENFDVSTLECLLLPKSNQIIVNESLKLTSEYFVKESFVESMRLNDGVLALVHQYFENSNDKHNSLLQLDNAINSNSELLKLLLELHNVDKEHTAFALTFFEICIKNGIDKGWSSDEIVTEFEKTAPKEVTDDGSFNTWLHVIRLLINGAEVKLEFTDEKSLVLRAMTLLLMNPEREQLEAIKAQLGDGVGDKVYKLALSFSLVRSGYSFFNHSKRQEINEYRKTIQLLNAFLHNKIVNPSIKINLVEQKEALNSEVNKITDEVACDDINSCDWLTKISYEEHYEIYQICGVKPLSGFDLKLVYIAEQHLSLRVIDNSGPKGMVKFSGQLLKELINVQSKLPYQSRFETNEHGLFLTLPPEWTNFNEFKTNMINLLNTLKPLKLEQKSSKLG